MPKPFFLLNVHDQTFGGRKAGDRDGEQISLKDAGGHLLKSQFLVVGLGMEIGPWQ